MSNIIPFDFKGKNLRVVMVNDEPHFVASDACEILEIVNVSQAIGRLDEDEKGICSIDTLGGIQEVWGVTESGLYSLALGSKKKEAKPFKRWITHDVLPSIRKHGAYMTPATLESMIASPEFGIKLLTALKNEREKVKVLEPKAQAWDDLAGDEGQLLSGRQIPKRYAFAGLTETAVKDSAIALGIRCKSVNEPTAEALRAGLARMMPEEIKIGNKRQTVFVLKYRMKAVEMIVAHWKQKTGRMW